MKVLLGVSNRHVHLTKETYEKLFDKPLKKVKPLRQPGQFASDSFVTLKNGENIIKNVRVIGPFRSYNQVEISKTDSYHLKINPPYRDSGNIKDSSPITICTKKDEVYLEQGCILANRHIHISPAEVKKYELENIKKVKLIIPSEKGGIIKNVHLKVDENYLLELHLDTDDANAFNLKTGDEIEIRREQK